MYADYFKEKSWQRLLRSLDSKWVSRPLAVYGLITLGAWVVALVGFGIITLLYFGIWIAIAVALVLALMASRRPSTVASPASRIVVSTGLPGSTRVLLAALERADAADRALIAQAALLIPALDQKAANEVAQAFVELEAEVGALVVDAPAFDERWSLQWTHKPSWAENQPYRQRLFSGAMFDELGQYMALRGRQIGWMIDFLITGDDKPVRHIRSWIKATEQKKQEVENGAEATASRTSSPLS